MSARPHRPTRRQVAAGAAWSAPTLMAAAAAPVFAASIHPNVSVASATACWEDLGGAASVYLTVNFQNNDVHAVTVTIPDTVTVGGVVYAVNPLAAGEVETVAPGASASIPFDASGPTGLPIGDVIAIFAVSDSGTGTTSSATAVVPGSSVTDGGCTA